jgi:rhodanese-related sulfurtransferase
MILFLLVVAVACKSTASRSDAAKTDNGASTEQTDGQEDNAAATYEVINVADFEAVLSGFRQEGTPVQLIDLRTPEELEETGYLKGAEHLDWNNGVFEAAYEKLNKDLPVMVYCRSGGRSGRAGAFLIENGFREVYDLDGGITAWLEEGKPVKMVE